MNVCSTSFEMRKIKANILSRIKIHFWKVLVAPNASSFVIGWTLNFERWKTMLEFMKSFCKLQKYPVSSNLQTAFNAINVMHFYLFRTDTFVNSCSWHKSNSTFSIFLTKSLFWTIHKSDKLKIYPSEWKRCYFLGIPIQGSHSIVHHYIGNYKGQVGSMVSSFNITLRCD